VFHLAAGADTLYIHDLAVTDAGRGEGAGRALVRCAMSAARTLNLRSACLIAIQGSAPYWEQIGFEVVSAPSTLVAAKLASYGAAAQLMLAPL
jgi:predicted N-acetyltransferase YhbS